jgi:hypothetical protein
MTALNKVLRDAGSDAARVVAKGLYRRNDVRNDEKDTTGELL